MIHVSKDSVINHDPCACCIGHFDGLHLGHQKLIERTLYHAQKLCVTPCMITFSTDPKNLFSKEPVRQLMTLEEKTRVAEELGIREIILLEFDREMAAMSPEVFVEKILVPLNIRKLVCGFDFRFANKAEGDTAYLLNSKIDTEVVEEVMLDGQKVSTTLIKQRIEENDLEAVFRLLGRPFTLSGKVIYGRQMGRKIGFKTANLEYAGDQFLLNEGVYAGKAIVEDATYFAMINVGKNPTFYKDYPISIEAHILDFDHDIYGKTISLEFYRFLRSERKFVGVEELVQQLQLDVESTKSYWNMLK